MLDIGPLFLKLRWPESTELDSKDSFQGILDMVWKIFFLGGLMVLTLAGLTGASEALPKTPFVDLDGDGFSDNFADNNDNAIPDRFESKAAEKLAEMGSLLGNVFNTEISLDDLRTTSQKFKMREFRTRSLAQRCNGLGAENDFGPGNGIGLGAVSGSGGGCAGGVCGP